MAGKVDTENLQHLESIVTATAVSGGVHGLPAPGLWAGSFIPASSLLEVVCPFEFWVGVLGNSWDVCPTMCHSNFKYSNE